MTLDEAIKDLEYGTKQLEMEIKSGLWIKGSESELRCKEGIALNKQHIEWLTELVEAKQLLKAAMSDLAEAEHCGLCKYEADDIASCQSKPANCFVWRYADEALKLIGGEPKC